VNALDVVYLLLLVVAGAAGVAIYAYFNDRRQR